MRVGSGSVLRGASYFRCRNFPDGGGVFAAEHTLCATDGRMRERVCGIVRSWVVGLCELSVCGRWSVG